jgi:hypothetical protein
MTASARARPSIPGYVKISRQLQAMFAEVISGTAPIDEITQRTAAFIGVISERPHLSEDSDRRLLHYHRR